MKYPGASLQNLRPTPALMGCGSVQPVSKCRGPTLSHPTQRMGGWQRHQSSPPPGRWGARENCGCIYRLRVRLLDVYENEVVKFSASPNPVLQWTERGYRQVSPGIPNFSLLKSPSQLASPLDVYNSNSLQSLSHYYIPGRSKSLPY